MISWVFTCHLPKKSHFGCHKKLWKILLNHYWQGFLFYCFIMPHHRWQLFMCILCVSETSMLCCCALWCSDHHEYILNAHSPRLLLCCSFGFQSCQTSLQVFYKAPVDYISFQYQIVLYRYCKYIWFINNCTVVMISSNKVCLILEINTLSIKMSKDKLLQHT